MSKDLIATAVRLSKVGSKRPKQADLKRSVSTAYYALFHALAKNAADTIVGVGKMRSDGAWTQVYRALDHGFAKNACKEIRNLGFPSEIISCAYTFVQLQEARHRADYDPNERITRGDAQASIRNAAKAILDLSKADRSTRRAFAVQLVIKKRS